jgi:hypothetical protein
LFKNIFLTYKKGTLSVFFISQKLFFKYLKEFIYFVESFGGLAQLARAFDWQSKGQRFDSAILHANNQTLTAM